MRKVAITLVLVAAIILAGWLLLDSVDRSKKYGWVGGFELTVELKPTNQARIRSVRAAPFPDEAEAESMRMTPEEEFDRVIDVKRSHGETMKFHITTCGIFSELGWRDTYSQEHTVLALWIELEDGSKHFITAPIPDGRRSRSMVVTVP